MSTKALTTPVMTPVALSTGTELTSSQRSSPSGVCTPRTSSRRASPVVRTSMAGRRWLGRSDPSSQRVRHWVSRPDLSVSGVRPSSRSAPALQSTIDPVRSWATRPSAIAATTAALRDSSASRATSARAAVSLVAATSASSVSTARSSSSKASGRDETAAITPTATPSCTSGTITEDRVPVLALTSAWVRGSVRLSRQSWPARVRTARPPRVPVSGMRCPTAGPVEPATARATRKAPCGWEAIAPSAGKTVSTDSASTWKVTSGSAAAQAMSR
jgi:hypothetical protein